MRLRVSGVLLALALAVAVPGPAVGAYPTPAAPTVTGLCSTTLDHFWTIRSTAAGLASYGIEYSTDFGVWRQAGVLAASGGAHSVVVVTERAAGSTLSARWAAYPDRVGSASANDKACEAAHITVTIDVQGGVAKPTNFAPTVSGRGVPESAAPRPPVPFTSGDEVDLDPGRYVVDPNLLHVTLDYIWLSTTCDTRSSTDRQKPTVDLFLLPGQSADCVIVYHLGPALTDGIAPGTNTGSGGFGSSTVTVPKGTYITYFVRTQPSLAGEGLEIWSRKGTGAWALLTTRTVASDGTLHYYARVTGTISYQARWPGVPGMAASTAHGRTAAASTTGDTRLVVQCDEFVDAQGTSATARLTREVWIRTGRTVTLSVCTNPSTGFEWTATGFDTRDLVLVRHWVTPLKSAAPGGEPVVGAPSIENWTFRALTASTNTVTITYSQPWKGGEKAVWRLALKVHGQG